MTSLLPPCEIQYSDANGSPYAGGTLTFFIPGTDTLKNTWQDSSQQTQNTNPVVLDSAGRTPPIFGFGDYRCVLKDSDLNLVFDQLTSSTLGESVISNVMLPVVGAATLSLARDLMGITGAIQNAVNTISLLPGPTGSAGTPGVAGATGPTGPTGPAGSSGSGAPTVTLNGNGIAAAWSNFVVQGGTLTGIGNDIGQGTAFYGTITFPVPFPNACFSVDITPVSNTDDLNKLYIIGLIGIVSISASSCYFVMPIPTAGSTPAVEVRWQAVGN